MDIDELEVTIRAQKWLVAAGITTVEDLVRLDWKQLNDIKNIGDKTISEICWQCIQVLNGRMTEQLIEYEKHRPSSQSNWKEIQDKARKYDAIVAIVSR